MRVATEKTLAPTATVGVYVGAGSRNDTLATSGASHVLRNMLTRGTNSHSRASFNEEIDSLGARLHGESGREQSSIGMTVFKNDIGRAIKLLGESIANTRLDPGELELLKQDVAADHEASYKDFKYTLIENAHYNSYRDHMLGQPIKGEADNLANLSVDDLKNFKAANYYGDNLVVVGTGNINHEEFCSQVHEALHSVSRSATGIAAN